MEKNIYIFLDKILKSNFQDFKYTYLFNEIFISINDKDGFLLFGINYKGNKLVINKYCGEDNKNGIILSVLIKKYENIFIKLLEESNKNSLKLGDESDFINIYDKKELNFNDIKNRLNFTFLDDYTFRRRSELDFTFENKSELSIYHSDFECSKCSGPKESFTSFPNFRDGLLDTKYFPNNKISKKSTLLVTNISDYESIALGGNKKIDDILSSKELLDEYELISINKTCISIIMGDDIKSVLKYNKIPLEKTVYTDQNIDSGYRAVISYFKNIELRKFEVKNNKLLFFGLNKNRNTYELINFLEKNFNIEVGNVLLPNINKRDLENIFSYKTAIFFKGKEVKTQSIFKLYPIENIETEVPYSLGSIYSLFKNILENYNKEKELILLSKIIDNYKLENDILFKKAKKYDIGFIIFDFHVEQFINDNFRGVNILDTLSDTGFNINFFVYSDNEKYSENIDILKNKVNNIIVSDSEEDLNNFIKNKNISLYYSEVNNDKRILDKNKEIFSIGDFEYGIDGFFRTFEKLIKKCEKVEYFNSLL